MITQIDLQQIKKPPEGGLLSLTLVHCHQSINGGNDIHTLTAAMGAQ